jgi:hypothetical protein
MTGSEAAQGKMAKKTKPPAREQNGGRSWLPKLHFFFLGAAFMLLEAQIVSRLALLFGTRIDVIDVPGRRPRSSVGWPYCLVPPG